jgi:hypothetical protein
MKYLIEKHEVTGKKGQSFFKNQVIDEKQFVDGSIDHLVSIKAISRFVPEEVKETPKKAAEKVKAADKTADKNLPEADKAPEGDKPEKDPE